MTETERILELESAIRLHRDQKSDDRCWLDDQKLYAVLNDGNLGDNGLPSREKFLNNCSRYYDNRCANADWSSYQELLEVLNETRTVIFLLLTADTNSDTINAMNRVALLKKRLDALKVPDHV